MTTTVKIEAHCGTDTVVQVGIQNRPGGGEDKTVTLKDGEKWEDVVYDDKQITVKEVPLERVGM